MEATHKPNQQSCSSDELRPIYRCLTLSAATFFSPPTFKKVQATASAALPPTALPLSPHLCRFLLGAENILEPPLPLFQPCTFHRQHQNNCVHQHALRSVGAVCPWLSDIENCIQMPTGTGILLQLEELEVAWGG